MVVPSKTTHPSVRYYFIAILFYNIPNEKRNIKRLKNIDVPAELSFLKN